MGIIQMMQWRAVATANPLKLTAATIEDSAPAANAVRAAILFQNNGALWHKRAFLGNISVAGEWLIVQPDTTAAALYEVRATLQSGAAPTPEWSNAMDWWHALSSDREWAYNRSAGTVGTSEGTILIEIRRASDLVVLASASFTLRAIQT